jgi:hypothetical protein
LKKKTILVEKYDPGGKNLILVEKQLIPVEKTRLNSSNRDFVKHHSVMHQVLTEDLWIRFRPKEFGNSANDRSPFLRKGPKK